MRQLITFCTLVVLVAAARAQVGGQATVISNYASTVVPPAGIYAAPFVPLVSTPSMSLATPPLSVGARNATEGNIAGASNATVSAVPAARDLFPTPVWYGAPRAQVQYEALPQLSEVNSAKQSFDFGVAPFESNVGVAQLAGRAHLPQGEEKAITNEDIQRLNQETGTVKYHGKTEKIE